MRLGFSAFRGSQACKRNGRGSMAASLVIFTDLDGTLLDHETYSEEPARPALERVRQLGVPLIFCSSKTRAEIEPLRRRLHNRHPFIVENGGAVFIPKGVFPFRPDDSREVDSYLVIELGERYEVLRRMLAELRRETELPLVGFGDMTADEVMRQTRLPRQEAVLAKRREYDEPFYSLTPLSVEEERRLEQAVRRHGLSLTRGARFLHLMGDNDKGKAVRLVLNLYERNSGRRPKSAALGDSLNDLPMLEAVDVPILVQKPGGEYDARVLEHLDPRRAPGVGPAGWNAAVMALLEESAV